MSSLPEVVADFNILSGTIKICLIDSRENDVKMGNQKDTGLVIWANKTIRATVHTQETKQNVQIFV